MIISKMNNRGTKIRTYISHWRNLGYDNEKRLKHAPTIARDNLKLLENCCIWLIPVIAFIMIVRCAYWGISVANILPFMLLIVEFLVMIILVREDVLLKRGIIKKNRILTRTVIFTLYLVTLYYDVVRLPEERNVLLCVFLVTYGTVFDIYPENNLKIAIGMFLLTGILEYNLESYPVFRYNMLNNVIAILIGCFVSWNKVKNKMEVLVREEYKKELQEKESQISIMMSQVQPHFLYNTLSTIRILCGIDVKKAQDSLLNFTEYIRENLDVLGSTEMIPVTQELGHVKRYVNLEQMRYGEKLQVEYDVQDVEFLIPPLTIQPVMENAIKYGAGDKRGGGTVKLMIRKEGHMNVIVVEDDGNGIDASSIEEIPLKDDGRTHIGLKNVKERVEKMADGKLDFYSRKGCGTIVTIYIPDEKD